MRLANKVALITGGGTGIGRATAELFAKEGAKVAVSGIPAEQLEDVVHTITARGGEAITIPGDVTNEKAAKQMVLAPIARWKRLNVLVNNAGVIRRKELHETTLDDWDYMMNTNVKGIYLVSKFAIPEMIQGGGGSIVNMGSDSGLVGQGDAHVYSASKGAVINLTRAMAISYGTYNIRVNAVCPSLVKTPMTLTKLQEGETWEEKAQEWAQMFPLRRLGRPSDIAYGCLYLASDEASWVTGTTLSIDGGITAQ